MKTASVLFALICAITPASVSWAQSLTANSPLAFGSFAPGASSGTVTITAAGARSAGGGAVLVSSGSGAAGSFSLSGGNPDDTYSVTLPGNGVVFLSLTGNPAITMAVNSFTSSTSGGQRGIGTLVFTVGATLSVASNQSSGSYSGSFNVTVDFN